MQMAFGDARCATHRWPAHQFQEAKQPLSGAAAGAALHPVAASREGWREYLETVWWKKLLVLRHFLLFSAVNCNLV